MTIRELVDQLREIAYKRGWDLEVEYVDGDFIVPIKQLGIATVQYGMELPEGQSTVVLR